MLTIPARPPTARRAWKAALSARGVRPRGPALDALAECFRFSGSQIEDAAETAAKDASRIQGKGGQQVDCAEQQVEPHQRAQKMRGKSGHPALLMLGFGASQCMWSAWVANDEARETR